MKKKDIQFVGFFLTLIGAVGAIASPPIAFNPPSMGGFFSVLAVIGLMVFWYGIRE
ncbi:MAG: hypothetical protein V1847_04890 [Candidatus Diapherotrites archaeon]